MRTLVIAGEYPWPENTGSRIRLAIILRGLQRCGPTELFSVVSKFRDEFDPPDGSQDLAKVGRVGFDNRPPSALGLVPALLRPGNADRAAPAGPCPGAAGHRPVHVRPLRPGLVLRARARGDWPASRCSRRPSSTSSTWRTRRSWPGCPVPGAPGRCRSGGSGGPRPPLVSEDEVRRWRRLHRRSSRRTAAVVVSSLLDAERATAAGVQRVEVIANGYPAVAHPVGRPTVGTPPTVLFQGLLRYPPNIDAARWLAGEIGPGPPGAGPRRGDPVGRGPPARTRRPRRSSPGDGDRSGPRHGGRAGPGRRRRRAGPLRQRHQAQDPRGVRPAGAGGVHTARVPRGSARRTASTCCWETRPRHSPMPAPACCATSRLRQELVSRAHSLFLEHFQSEVIEQEVADARPPGGRETRPPGLIRHRGRTGGRQ